MINPPIGAAVGSRQANIYMIQLEVQGAAYKRHQPREQPVNETRVWDYNSHKQRNPAGEDGHSMAPRRSEWTNTECGRFCTGILTQSSTQVNSKEKRKEKQVGTAMDFTWMASFSNLL